MTRIKLLIALYIIGIFVSYGHIYKLLTKEHLEWCKANEIHSCDMSNAEFGAVMFVSYWPVYYGLHYSRILWEGKP